MTCTHQLLSQDPPHPSWTSPSFEVREETMVSVCHRWSFLIVVGGASSTSKGPTKPNGPKTCSPVNCQGKEKTCPYGYQKKDGCEICRCNDPCNPPGKVRTLLLWESVPENTFLCQAILCGSKKRCFVEKKPDGTFGTSCGTTPSYSNKNGGKLTKGNSSSEIDWLSPRLSFLPQRLAKSPRSLACAMPPSHVSTMMWERRNVRLSLMAAVVATAIIS